MDAARLVAPWWARILWVVIGLTITAPIIVIAAPSDDPLVPAALLYVALLGMSVLIERGRGGGLVTLGLAAHRHVPYDLMRGMVFALGSIGVIAAIALGLGATFVAVGVPWTSAAIVSIIITSMAAGGEEILFRGVIFQAIEERFGGIAAIVVTSVPFGLAHASNPGASALSVVNTILAGVALGAMASHYRSLWPGIAFHVVWNVVLAMCIGPLSGITSMPYATWRLETSALVDLRWLVDGVYGIEQGLLTTVLLVAITVGVYRSGRYDAFVYAARTRRALSAAAQRYTPSSVSSSPHQAPTQDRTP
jgi:uncharacterized protein